MFDWRHYLSPERAARSAFHIFVVILLGLFALVVAGRFLAAINLSLLDLIAFALFWLLVSVGAYAIREGRRPQRQRQRPLRGVERTPLVPPEMEDDL